MVSIVIEALLALAVLLSILAFLLAIWWRIREYRHLQKTAGRSATVVGFLSHLNTGRPGTTLFEKKDRHSQPRSSSRPADDRLRNQTAHDMTVRQNGMVLESNVERDRVLFICYRRDDTSDAAGRLHDNLANKYGDNRVFMDIDSVPLGADFVEHVTSEIASCSAVIVMIGRQWLSATDKKGRRRLDSTEDLVRVEIAAAVQRQIPVIPVLVHEADMPSAEDLPENIRPLSRRNGIDLSGPAWRGGIERLIKELDRVMKA